MGYFSLYSFTLSTIHTMYLLLVEMENGGVRYLDVERVCKRNSGSDFVHLSCRRKVSRFSTPCLVAG
jgi:hypothetical protein